ncbi:MAG: bifunctional demethylmenaquinone methyltransferase/2-methoxy-6-polyprenyl-1,4-benzoquinol methylase UbiE [Gammaproteobacteria bacterium]|nr:bifunctional demethylmenaquinone methyltransferase/2-methoxy-6-polyprenyl-1,4-benzoquinol methylase UbiE [Gammaproteobacteria bacterium]
MLQSDETHFGFKKVPIAEKARRVAGVFHSVADRYDVMNDLMSLGSHRLMKRFAVELTCARPGDNVMDLAGGTGDLAKRLTPLVGPSGQVVLCDINESMLTIGRQRLHDKGIVSNVSFVQGDAEDLPFPDNHFNAVAMAFGLRNVTNKDKALSSILRVLKSGGRIVILEFSRPVNPGIKQAYDAFSNLWPKVGELITGDRDSYQYLVESIKMHPQQEELAEIMTDAGFSSVKFHNLLNGVVAIHLGIKDR